MTRCSLLATLTSLTIYAIIIGVGLWLWLKPVPVQSKPLKKVDVNLAMFAAPRPEITPPPVKVPEAVQPPKPEPKPEPVKKPEPKPVEKPKQKPKPVENPKQKPKPVKKPEPKPVEKPKPEPKPQPIKEKVVDQPVVEETVTEPEPIVAPQPIPELPPAPQFSAQEVANAEDIYLNQLRELIVQYAQDTYPRRAKRRHWEGIVTLSFTLHRNGKISDLEIITTSGRSILDKAALSIITEQMQSKFKTFPEEIDRDTWEIHLPVSYQLR